MLRPFFLAVRKGITVDVEKLEDKIGYCFTDKSLLKTALTHSSFANEHKDKSYVSSERLEFLGDSVLGMIVASHLYKNYPAMAEGRMTRLRAELVCETSLLAVANQLKLGEHIRFGKGEEISGGRQRPSILADAVESVLAAVYLDGGMENACRFVSRFILSDLDKVAGFGTSDHKTALQELVQQNGPHVLVYEMIGEEGPDHKKTFTARVSLNGKGLGTGSGRSKKEAEQASAHAALTYLGSSEK